MQNLIPKHFVNIMETFEPKQLKYCVLEPYSLNHLKKPLSSQYYNLHNSYKNPYVKSICVKKMKMEYPGDNEIYDNDLTDDSIVGSGVLNL